MPQAHHTPDPRRAGGKIHTGQAAPVTPTRGVLWAVGVDKVSLPGGFWGSRQQLNATAIIPHCEAWVERMGWTGNFDAAAAGRLPEDRRGREFSDADVYKLLEAMAWEIARTGDSDMDARLGSLVQRIARAQEPDGYLNTMFGRPGQDGRYSDLKDGHELYCFGHLIQAGVARGRTHGHDQLVEVAVQAADHVCETFGPDGVGAVCGHPEIEMALAELFRFTQETRYLDQARLFVERRGHGLLGEHPFGASYYQDDVPVRDATVMNGHAVRALYLASGAADVAVETGDDDLLDSIARQLSATWSRRTYLTGGMGAHHEGESFGRDYELPADRAYSETCAGVASVMLNHRLLLATGDVVHADAIERTLFNVVAASFDADGHAFFYTNPLHQRVPGTAPDPDLASPRAASSLRAPWFEVSCCPTNVARTLASLEAYVATVDPDGLQLHQYADADIRVRPDGRDDIAVEVRTRYPADGLVSVKIVESPTDPWTLSLRVPGWVTDHAVLTVAGQASEVPPGYTPVRRVFKPGDVIELSLPVQPRWTWPHPRIDALRGTVAVERGPLVLCLESVDLGASVNDVQVVPSSAAPPHSEEETWVDAEVLDLPEPSWPYTQDRSPGLPRSEHRQVSLIPYHQWAGRGPSTMRVWLPVAAGDRPDRA